MYRKSEKVNELRKTPIYIAKRIYLLFSIFLMIRKSKNRITMKKERKKKV
jgi:hypothetical protein